MATPPILFFGVTVLQTLQTLIKPRYAGLYTPVTGRYVDANYVVWILCVYRVCGLLKRCPLLEGSPLGALAGLTAIPFLSKHVSSMMPSRPFALK